MSRTRTACGCEYEGQTKVAGCRIHPGAAPAIPTCPECGCPMNQHGPEAGQVVCRGCGVVGCAYRLGALDAPGLAPEVHDGLVDMNPPRRRQDEQAFGCGCVHERIGGKWSRTKACARHASGGGK